MDWQPIETAPRDGSDVLVAAHWTGWDDEAEDVTSGWHICVAHSGHHTIFGHIEGS